ncbi:MAG: ribulose 1,5-bisphosphate carboxylase [Xanthobacteraceae bacterium]|nr:ribulose 1,5-bisphosphate carboxylase [Xanthobacteraceae bacterium]
MPVTAIDDRAVLAEIVGRVEDVREIGGGLFEARISLSAATVGRDAGQLLNMLFGNTSLHDDVTLHDAEIPGELAAVFGGPRHGLDGLRRRAGAGRRALTCAAIKPQGLPPAKLADIARAFTAGGIDYIKDDHGLADQSYSPFRERVAAIATTLADAKSRYVPSITGDLDAMRRQIAIVRDAGIDTVMVAPMVSGVSSFHRLVADNPDMAFLAHPSLAGAARIAPPFHFGGLFRMLGADAVIFPHHGGRFGYSAATCKAIAERARNARNGLKPCVPVLAGGMSRERVGEILEFYGADIMLLIGGALLEAREHLTQAATAFVDAVHDWKPI